jgi:hypothetical protein
LPQRGKGEVKLASLCQIGAFYIASSTEPSRLIGRVEPPSPPGVELVGGETVSPEKYIAHWLIHSAVPPFIVGVTRKAHPEPSFRVTEALSAVHFCDTSGGFVANLELVRQAHAKIGLLDWKKVVSSAICTYSDYVNAPSSDNSREKERLKKLLEKTPELSAILPALGVRPGSGEFKVLSWYNKEGKDG